MEKKRKVFTARILVDALIFAGVPLLAPGICYLVLVRTGHSSDILLYSLGALSLLILTANLFFQIRADKADRENRS